MSLVSLTRRSTGRSATRHRHRGRLAIGMAMAIGALVAGRGVAFAANSCIWIGASGGSFGTPGNWTGCGGLSPQSADAVFFDPTMSSGGFTGTNNACTISAAVNVASITVQNGYTRIVSTSGSPSLLVGSMTVTTGTFTAGASPMRITGSLTING